MLWHIIICAFIVATGGSPLQSVAHSNVVVEDRLAVIKSTRQASNSFTFGFHTTNGKLRYKYTENDGWSDWIDLGSPSGTEVISNPSAVHDAKNLTKVFCLCADGQVYSIEQDAQKTTAFGKWMVISIKLPMDKGAVLNGKDNVKALIFQGKVSVFARTLAKSSRLYWTQENNGNWTSWSLIGGTSVALKTDMTVVYNGFSKYLEAFAVMENKYMYRTWQTSPSKWVSWDKTGYRAPTSVHAPVAHQMPLNFFNGAINVFVFGEDGYIHHIWQTTCDKVPNPWGWCTWSLWYKIGSAIPKSAESANPLSIGANIHNGIEVFTVSSDGGLWHLWELEQGSDWSSWEYVGRPKSGPIASHPAIINDDKGWWAAYALGFKDDIEIVEQNRSLQLSPAEAPAGKPVIVSWMVPVDEATAMDWIGVYPSGSDNNMYVDFYYVGGGQNPGKNARSKGSLTFTSYLPKGKYDYRYLVNKKFFDAITTPFTVVSGPTDKEWVQVYRGIAAGLGKYNVSFETCAKDGEQTVETFKQAFEAFDNKQVYRGMQLIGQALIDVYKAFEACEETAIAKKLEKLANDFIKCTAGNCVNFAIDSIEEIIILFENVYEIYGDVKGASNSFKIEAYEQGGWCVGRVVAVCLAIPT
ncbi:uncharacterized protein LOC116296948 [Actinia tenebrosa]|uniref:Uncharacterized protein LOC116296948 n=1 Tax=Actinia tenebrosa TaxID=6105 RepID=A0A6P8HX09_ACTTE|nr:uncharacterized protein LOC116296948 [Actinia tenebrosa]